MNVHWPIEFVNLSQMQAKNKRKNKKKIETLKESALWMTKTWLNSEEMQHALAEYEMFYADK